MKVRLVLAGFFEGLEGEDAVGRDVEVAVSGVLVGVPLGVGPRSDFLS
jgi:hypothetical protein